MAGATATVALALAVTGIFGLAALIVERRAAEIGLRIAVRASVRDVVRLMVRDSLRPVLIGSAVGVGIAVLIGRVMESVMYGVSGHDPLAVLGAVAVLAAAALLAAIVPTRRVAQVDSVLALRRQ